MALDRIITEQLVAEEKLQRAKELRKEMTVAESILWQQLGANKLRGLHFRRQQIIDGFIADFYCHASAVVVELDGPLHEQSRDEDADRDCIFSQRGLLVTRFTNEQVLSDLATVLETIARMCEERFGKV